MEGYKMRMFEEGRYIVSRISALEAYINTPDFKALSWRVKWCMRMQLFFMRRYYFWLAERIELTCSLVDIAEWKNALKEPATDVAATSAEIKEKPKTKRSKSKKKKSNE